MTPLLIYVAGPYRAPTAWQREQNIHRARVWGMALAKAGAYPVIPHANTAHFDGEAEDTLWLAGTLRLMHRCDGVLMIDGWSQSTGARAEREDADRYALHVLDADGWSSRGGANVGNDLREWLRLIAKARGTP